MRCCICAATAALVQYEGVLGPRHDHVEHLQLTHPLVPISIAYFQSSCACSFHSPSEVLPLDLLIADECLCRIRRSVCSRIWPTGPLQRIVEHLVHERPAGMVADAVGKAFPDQDACKLQAFCLSRSENAVQVLLPHTQKCSHLLLLLRVEDNDSVLRAVFGWSAVREESLSKLSKGSLLFWRPALEVVRRRALCDAQH
eukprot:2953513-Rhodomonas_salina.2